MTGSRDDPPSQVRRQVGSFFRRLPGRPPYAVILTVQCNNRHVNFGALCKPSFDIKKSRFARRVSHAMPIRMNHDIDKFRVVE